MQYNCYNNNDCSLVLRFFIGVNPSAHSPLYSGASTDSSGDHEHTRIMTLCKSETDKFFYNMQRIQLEIRWRCWKKLIHSPPSNVAEICHIRLVYGNDKHWNVWKEKEIDEKEIKNKIIYLADYNEHYLVEL